MNKKELELRILELEKVIRHITRDYCKIVKKPCYWNPDSKCFEIEFVYEGVLCKVNKVLDFPDEEAFSIIKDGKIYIKTKIGEKTHRVFKIVGNGLEEITDIYKMEEDNNE